MMSKEKQALKNLKVEENDQEQNEGVEQAAAPNGEESRHLGGKGEGQKPAKRGLVKRFVPSFRWIIPSKHTDRSEVKDDAERFVGQMMEVRRKTKEQQVRHYKRFQTPEPDNHYDFCLIP
ncbi:protein BEX4 [Erinaceus europaeus]|uniref:Protein BEX4 n=1 Tax=Erinaceus europaeus TaxID=9365 RepID=A0A1S3AMC4_ERIEU|nr:protein BEX4 [Erinaceus europaeus]